MLRVYRNFSQHLRQHPDGEPRPRLVHGRRQRPADAQCLHPVRLDLRRCGNHGLATTLICAIGTAVGAPPHVRDRRRPLGSAIARLPGELRDVFRNHSFMMLLLTDRHLLDCAGHRDQPQRLHLHSYFWHVDANTIPHRLDLRHHRDSSSASRSAPSCSAGWRKKTICTGGIVAVCALLFVPPVAAHRPSVAGERFPARRDHVRLRLHPVGGADQRLHLVQFDDGGRDRRARSSVRRPAGGALLLCPFLRRQSRDRCRFALRRGFALDYIIMFPHDLSAHPNQGDHRWLDARQARPDRRARRGGNPRPYRQSRWRAPTASARPACSKSRQ